MRELVILSGKGGTGKTSVAASLAFLARPVTMADCDVDAPDLALVVRPEPSEPHDFRAGWLAVMSEHICLRCGRCAELCRFDAISWQGAGGGRYVVDPLACEGCGLCERVCTRNAISITSPLRGWWRRSTTELGVLYHAEMDPGSENSGKLVALLRRQARDDTSGQTEWLITDGPPGIGCAAIASVTGAAYVLFVAEPTPSSLHDLRRVAQLVAGFGVPAAVVVNKWDLSPDGTEKIEAFAVAAGLRCAGRIPYDQAFAEAQIAGKSVVGLGDGPSARALEAVWRSIQEAVRSPEAPSLRVSQ